MATDRHPSQDEVVAAVLSGTKAAQHLVKRFTEAIGDAADLPEIASGGFVWFHELSDYENLWDLSALEARVSAQRLAALAADAAPTEAERLIYTKRKLAEYFAEPVEGAGYVIGAVVDSSGRKAYWAEVREGSSWEGVRREVLGIFPSVKAAKSALRCKGLLSPRDYRPELRPEGRNKAVRRRSPKTLRP